MRNIAGVDEVGRGPLAGPVVAAAVILPKNHDIIGLRDSKKLTKKKREALFPLILQNANGVGIGKSNVKIIDRINIREATFYAMNMALERLPILPDKALVDGHSLKNINIPNEGIIRGDDKVESIMAASIIAKVTRDRLMEEYAVIFPEYGFENHSGYGTKYHIEALVKYRATPIHRRTFTPVKKNMPTIAWLKDNNRLDWMCEKLAALYLRSQGATIIEMNKINRSTIIVGKEKGEIFFTKVYNVSKKEKQLNKDLIKSIGLKKLERELEKAKDEYSDYKNIPIDVVFVRLKKNKYPDIKHFRGIEFN